MVLETILQRSCPSCSQHHYRQNNPNANILPSIKTWSDHPKVNPPKDIENDVCQISVLLQLAKVLEMIQLQLNS